MKKLLISFAALVLSLIGLARLTNSVQAETTTNPGQSIITNLEKGANNGKLQINDADLNQARNYVNSAQTTITQAQADAVNADINHAREIIDVYAPSATSYSEVGQRLSASKKEALRQTVYHAAKQLSLTVTFGQGDANGSSDTTDSNVADETSTATANATDSNIAPTITDKQGKVIYEPASTTGSNGTTIIALGLILSLLAGGFYLTRKYQRTTD